jgi:hypothetical protein
MAHGTHDPENPLKSVSVYLTPEQLAQVQRRARETGSSVSAQLRAAVALLLARS